MRLSGHQLDKCFQSSSSSSSTRSLPNNSKEGATPTLRIHQRTKERERERESGVKECKERERELRLSKRPNKREIGVH